MLPNCFKKEIIFVTKNKIRPNPEFLKETPVITFQVDIKDKLMDCSLIVLLSLVYIFVLTFFVWYSTNYVNFSVKKCNILKAVLYPN